MCDTLLLLQRVEVCPVEILYYRLNSPHECVLSVINNTLLVKEKGSGVECVAGPITLRK